MTKNYDPNQIVQSFAGIPILGYAKGTFVNVAFNADAFNLTVGSSGEGCRAKTNDRSMIVTFTLLQSTQTNDLLSAIHNVDLLSPNGDGVGPYLLKDLQGTTLYTAETMWIKKFADLSYSDEVDARVWTLETDAGLANIGGNLSL